SACRARARWRAGSTGSSDLVQRALAVDEERRRAVHADVADHAGLRLEPQHRGLAGRRDRDQPAVAPRDLDLVALESELRGSAERELVIGLGIRGQRTGVELIGVRQPGERCAESSGYGSEADESGHWVLRVQKMGLQIVPQL